MSHLLIRKAAIKPKVLDCVCWDGSRAQGDLICAWVADEGGKAEVIPTDDGSQTFYTILVENPEEGPARYYRGQWLMRSIWGMFFVVDQVYFEAHYDLERIKIEDHVVMRQVPQ